MKSIPWWGWALGAAGVAGGGVFLYWNDRPRGIIVSTP